MPKEIKNKLRDGLPSKIYLLAFNGPIAGYAIAQRIQNCKTPQTAKIYERLDEMQEENMIEKKEIGKTKTGKIQTRCIAKTEVLLPEIKSFLAEKEIKISDIEEHILLKYLDSVNFRTHVEESFFYQKTFFVNAVDAVKHIAEVLGGLALREYVCRDEEKDKENVVSEKKYRSHRVADFKTKKEIDVYWAEHIRSKIDYENIKIKRTLVTRLLEEDYFEKKGKFKENEHYEYFEKNRYIAKSGKKIKYWICHPEYVTFLPSSLIKKLYKASPSYDLIQRIDPNALFALWRVHPENMSLFSSGVWDVAAANYFSNFWQEPQDIVEIKKMDKTLLKCSLEEQEKREEEQRQLEEERRKQREEQLKERSKDIKLKYHRKQVERLTKDIDNEKVSDT
jgi:hypothetical protein